MLTQLGRIYVVDLSEQKQCYFGLFLKFWDSLLICRIRYAQDDGRERQQFIESLNVDWQMVHSFITIISNLKVDDSEKAALAEQLRNSSQKNIDTEPFFKVILPCHYLKFNV